jgi:hypothetical protein
MQTRSIVLAHESHLGKRVWLLALGVVVTSLACSLSGGAASQVSTPTLPRPGAGQSSAVEQPTSAPATSGSSSTSKRNFDTMDACAMFPGDAVAKALGAAQADPPNGSNYGAAGVNCSYSLIPSGSKSGIGKIYNVYLFGPEYYDVNAGGLENPQPIQGLGDKAEMGYRSDSEEYDLIALNNGDISIEVLGDDSNLVQELAKYVMANLQP